VVTLPLVDVAPEAPTRVPASDGNTVLIVDANPITRAMFKALLQPHAGAVVFAADMTGATERLRTGDIDRVLIDGGTVPTDEPLPALAALVVAARAGGATTTLLWNGGAPAWLAEVGLDSTLAKPIAGRALVSHFFALKSKREPDGALVPCAA
jgi:DNA-binding NarL/FixJ family response regulator